MRRHPAQEREGAEKREHELGQELPQRDAEQHQPEHLELLAGRGRRVLVLLRLGLEQGGLAKGLPPLIGGFVQEKLSRYGGERVARRIDGPHEEYGRRRVEALVEIELPDGDRRRGEVAGRARGGRDGDQDMLLDGPRARVQTEGPLGKGDADLAIGQDAGKPQPHIVGCDLDEENRVGRVRRPKCVYL